jgi:hypothetical protein
MILDSTTQTLEIVLGEAKATMDCDVIACYGASSTATFRPHLVHGATNGTAPVTIVPAPDIGMQFQVNELRVWNKDTISHLVTLQLRDDTTVRIVRAASVAAGAGFLYTPGS